MGVVLRRINWTVVNDATGMRGRLERNCIADVKENTEAAGRLRI